MTEAAGIVLDEPTAALLGAGAVVVVASCSAARVPSLAHAWSATPSPDRRRLRVVVPLDTAEVLLADLAAGGPVAAVFCLPTTFGTFQLKGRSAAVLPVVASDEAAVAAQMEKLREQLLAVGDPAPFVAAYTTVDSRRFAAFEFTLDAVFAQTPGPGAGAKVA
jgi:hypothetical protein